MASTLTRYLTEHHVPYEVMSHQYTASSLETAAAAHVPGSRMAKSVLLGDEHGYVLAVLAASRRVDFGELQRQLKRPLGLVGEEELCAKFQDCDIGAVPPVGAAYGIETVVDSSLVEQTDIYMEAGDHEQLVHISGEDFEDLFDKAQCIPFSRRI